jgi:hypothetical protein
MTDIMVDLETMSTSMDAQILTIGAVAFDRKTFKILDEFYRRIDLASCEEIGLRKSQSTVEFWEKQSEDAKNEAFNAKNRVHIKDAMHNFVEFWLKNNGQRFWCNGANFDEPILSTVFERINFYKPWKFWDVRCVRTYLAVAGRSMKDYGFAAHNALLDCKNQLKAMEDVTAKLESMRNLN